MEKLILCRREREKLVLDYENLGKIKEIKNFDPESPIAIISFIGEPESGKTTHTNLVIQNLQHKSGNGWLDKIDASSTSPRKVEKLPGFSIWSDTKDPVEEDSEISLWPEAFCIKRHGFKINVLLLHLHYSIYDKRSNGRDSLEYLLTLLSSRICEVIWKQNEFRYLDIYQQLGREKCLDYACNSVVYLLRRNNERIKVVGRDAVKWLESRIPNKTLAPLNRKMKSIGIVHVPDSDKKLQTSRTIKRGYLELESDMYNALYDSTSLIVDDEHVFPKITSEDGKLLVGSNLQQHFNNCLEIVGRIFGFRPDIISVIEETTNDVETENTTQGDVPPAAAAQGKPPPPPPPPPPNGQAPPPPPPPPPPNAHGPPPPPPPPTVQQPPPIPTFEQTVQPPPASTVQTTATTNSINTSNIITSVTNTSTVSAVPVIDPTKPQNDTIDGTGSFDDSNFLSGIKGGFARLKPPVPPRNEQLIAGKPSSLLDALNSRFKAMHGSVDTENNGDDNEDWETETVG